MAVGYSSFVTPAGNLAPAIHGANFDAPFTNTAVFTGTCSAGEYRQYVKGENKANGSVVSLVLCGPNMLQPNVYLEDGCPPAGCSAYGYRVCPDHPYNKFTPARADGSNFSMYDAPGFKNTVRGTTYIVNFSFQGKLVDTSNHGAILAANDWTVQGTAVAPEAENMVALVGLSATEKMIGAHTTVNADTGVAELHIVITRPGGLPGIDGTSIKSTLIDTTGKRTRLAEAPAVYEVGTDKQTTVSLVYTLGTGTALPSAVEIAIHGGIVTMQIRRRDNAK